MMTGRVFTLALQPAWRDDELRDFLNEQKGTATIYAITHDSDIGEAGEPVTPHTHFYVEYDTPRKLSTVANLFHVAPNFVEVVRNKKASLRYLAHLDAPDKCEYSMEAVLTNSTIEYAQLIMAQDLTDKDIARYISDGRGIDLLGLVPSGKLRTIQAFLHFDSSNALLQETRSMRHQLDRVVEVMDKVEQIVTSVADLTKVTLEQSTSALQSIASEIRAFRKTAKPAPSFHSTVKSLKR